MSDQPTTVKLGPLEFLLDIRPRLGSYPPVFFWALTAQGGHYCGSKALAHAAATTALQEMVAAIRGGTPERVEALEAGAAALNLLSEQSVRRGNPDTIVKNQQAKILRDMAGE